MKFFIIIIALLSLTACGGSDDTQQTELSTQKTTQANDQKQEIPAGIQIPAKTLHVEEMANSDRRAIEERKKPSTKVMTTQAEFEAELAIFTGDVPAVTIDPSRQQVILVNAGYFSDIRRKITLGTAYDTGKLVKVKVLHSTKGEGCAISKAFSVPYLFALVDTTKPIEIVQEYITKNCVKEN